MEQEVKDPTLEKEAVNSAEETSASEAVDMDEVETCEGEVEETVAEETSAEECEAGETAPEEQTEGSSEEKSGFFGKKKKKDKKDVQIEELTDKVKRTMAEFENFRKRNEREKTHMYEVGAKDIIEKMLPIVDNFERGLASIPEDQKDGAVAQGMEMIYKQMITTFEQIGVKEVEALGKEFDPDFHNAVMHEDNDEVGENIIVEVFQKGYTYRDSVIRYSMVKVAN